MSYIYKIINDINRKVYIGQTIQPPYLRWAKHLMNINDENCNMEIIKAMRELGWEHFNFKVIEEVPQEQLNEREFFWIQQFNSCEDGYNENYPKGFNVQSNKNITSNGKRICKMTLDCQELEVYNTTREAVEETFPEASEAEIKTKMKCIAAVAKGNRKTAYGFKWKYKF